jgi:hypothetical protein
MPSSRAGNAQLASDSFAPPKREFHRQPSVVSNLTRTAWLEDDAAVWPQHRPQLTIPQVFPCGDRLSRRQAAVRLGHRTPGGLSARASGERDGDARHHEARH